MVFHLDHSIGDWHRYAEVLKSTEMGFNHNGFKSRSFRTNTSHNGQEIIVGMGTPGVRVGTRWLDSAHVVRPMDSISFHGPSSARYRPPIPACSNARAR